MNAAELADMQKAEKLKAEANAFFKGQKLEEACGKYTQAIQTIRLNETLRNKKSAVDVEMACRGNLALCKLNLKDYNAVIENCEKVLENDPNNVKASYRMAQAVFAVSEGTNESQLKSALKYAE